MNLKAIIQKIASWFKSEVAVVDQDVKAVESTVVSDLYTLKTQIGSDGSVFVAGFASPISTIEATMSTPAAATPVTTGNNVNTAVQIALALKAIDVSLSVEAVQAATNAALAAAYPIAAAA